MLRRICLSQYILISSNWCFGILGSLFSDKNATEMFSHTLQLELWDSERDENWNRSSVSEKFEIGIIFYDLLKFT